jgi:hypothetical protein
MHKKVVPEAVLVCNASILLEAIVDADRACLADAARRFLVNRHQFTSAEWLQAFTSLVAAIERYRADLNNPAAEKLSGGLDPREPLLWAYCVLLSMPQPELQDYEGLIEHSYDRSSGIADQLESLRAQEYRFAGDASIASDRLRWLAVLVRTLDADLAQLYFCPSGAEADDWTPETWRVPGYPCFLVPVNRAHRLKDRKPATRRAIQYHAVVPTEAGAYRVVLTRLPDQLHLRTRTAPRPYVYGAALFENLTLRAELIGEDEFRLTGVDCRGQQQIMQAHIRKAREEQCDVLLWPELTVPTGMVAHLKAFLKGEALSRQQNLELIVCGSWHERDSTGRWRNRSIVLDGRGDEVLHYDKRRKFSHDFPGDKRRTEAIEPGAVLPVLAVADRLIAFSICKDTCDHTERWAYAALDVDLVLVPSLGDGGTTHAQLLHAAPLYTERETSTVLVQQEPVLSGTDRQRGLPLGYSLVVPQPDNAEAPEQEQDFRLLRPRQ